MLSQEYINNPRMSQSKLKHILDGVEEFKYALDNPREPSDEMNLGSAVHLLLLEPHNYDKIIKMEKYSGSTREGKIFKFLRNECGMRDKFKVVKKPKKADLNAFEITEAESEFVVELLNKYGNYFRNPENYISLSESEYEKAHKMVEAVQDNEDARHLLQQCEAFEKTHFFDYEGIKFKCQVDAEGSDFILDLKTTGTVTSDLQSITREIYNRRYDFQAATYLIGAQKPKYFIVFVRSIAPYGVFPVELSEEVLNKGASLLDTACEIYKKCLRSNPNFKPNNKIRKI